jgi:hypothetical protein
MLKVICWAMKIFFKQIQDKDEMLKYYSVLKNYLTNFEIFDSSMSSILELLVTTKSNFNDSLFIDVDDLFPLILDHYLEDDPGLMLHEIISTLCEYGHFDHNCIQIQTFFRGALRNQQQGELIPPILELENFNYFSYLKEIFDYSFPIIKIELGMYAIEIHLQIFEQCFLRYGNYMEKLIRNTNFIETIIIHSRDEMENIKHLSMGILALMASYRSESLRNSIYILMLNYNPKKVSSMEM